MTYNNLIPGLTQNPYHYRWKSFGQSHEVIIQQQFEYGIAAVLWDCEQVLAAYVSSVPDRWVSKSCLELGAGTAMAAIVAWRLGAFAVGTDLPEAVADVTQLNVSINTASEKKKKASSCVAAPLSWGNDEHVAECEVLLKKAKAAGHVSTSDDGYDFVIAADVIYHSDQHEPLHHTLLQLVKPKTTFIFVHRKRFDNDSNFLDLLMASFTPVKATPVAQVEPQYPKDNLTIYEFRLPEVAAELMKTATAKAGTAASSKKR